MGNVKFDAENHYFSGQGVIMLGRRNAVTGEPQGLRAVGNVPDMKITVGTTVIDHKGSQDGQRATDKRLQTETKVTCSITIENWIAKNLAKALRGDNTVIPGSTVTAEEVDGFVGLVSSLKYISVSNVVVKQSTTTLVEYTDGVTPWDYKLNQDAGSIKLNNPDETGVAYDSLVPGTQVSATGVTVGATTAIALTVPTGAAVGQSVSMSGFTGTDAADLNGVTATITSVGSGTISVNVNSTGDTITVGAGKVQFLDIDTPIALLVDYAYADQQLVDSLTQPLTDTWIRFEGLNTVEENSPVIVDIFRFSNDPLKELSLLSDTFGQFVLEGAVLKDDTRLTGSKYFSVKKLN